MLPHGCRSFRTLSAAPLRGAERFSCMGLLLFLRASGTARNSAGTEALEACTGRRRPNSLCTFLAFLISSGEQRAMACPAAPARAVRPMRCT